LAMAAWWRRLSRRIRPCMIIHTKHAEPTATSPGQTHQKIVSLITDPTSSHRQEGSRAVRGRCTKGRDSWHDTKSVCASSASILPSAPIPPSSSGVS
jgi:hypothetical protein